MSDTNVEAVKTPAVRHAHATVTLRRNSIVIIARTGDHPVCPLRIMPVATAKSEMYTPSKIIHAVNSTRRKELFCKDFVPNKVHDSTRPVRLKPALESRVEAIG